MKTPIEHQIISKDGKPEFAVIPYAVFKKLEREYGKLDKPGKNAQDIDEMIKNSIPLSVVEIEITEGKSLARSWREYLKLSQAEVAERMGVTQAALSQLENSDTRLRASTKKKLAKALGVRPEQLDS